jgi:hypothetical protein
MKDHEKELGEMEDHEVELGEEKLEEQDEEELFAM